MNVNIIFKWITTVAAFVILYEFKEIVAKNATEPAEFKPRTPVKLTMRQGLIMNQVTNAYGLSDVRNTLCKNHTEEFKEALRAFEPWAIKMFDASSKLMPGFLEGNLAEAGSYEQCLDIYEHTKYGPIRGKHCGIRITVSDELLHAILKMSRNVSDKYFLHLKKTLMDGMNLVWSVCVPHSCTHEDVFRHYNKIILDLTEGLNLTVSLRKEYCVSKDDLPEISTGTYVFIIICCVIIAIVIICTIIDYCSSEMSSIFVDLFSGIKNGKLLLKTKESEDDLSCMHGIRFISILYVLTGHRYIHLMVRPTINSMYLVTWLQTFFSTIVTGGSVSVDSFFVVGAVLLSYNFFNRVTKAKNFNLFYFYLYRHIRIGAPLIFTIAMHALFLHHIGGGPFYYDFIYKFQRPCQVFWWTTLLHIQPYVNKKFLCIIQTWYLSIDMIYYYLSPLILIPLWKKPIYGYVSLVAFFILGVFGSFYTAWIWSVTGEMPITRNIEATDYFSEFYIQPHCRAPPYILGLAAGYALFKTKNQKVKIRKIINILGWLLSFIAMFAILLSAHMFHVDEYHYNRMFSSFYAAFHRSIWSLALIWIIWACVQGYGGFVNDFLSHPAFKVLSRLSYSIFLLHYAYQGAMQASEKTPGYFSNFQAIYMSLGDMALMVALCSTVALCFEYPFVRAVGLLIKPGSPPGKVDPRHKSEKLERVR